MNMRSLFSRLCHSPIPRCAAVTLVMLVALAWSGLAFCGEIHDAAKSGDLAKVKALLQFNPDLVFSKDNDGNTPLHWAAQEGHRDVAELLLANKAAVNSKDKYGRTPMCWAAFLGHKDVVVLLLANKAGADVKDMNGDTPLHLAANEDVAELLLANRAKINARDNDGRTPLHGAASQGHKAVVELLLAKGAEVNAKDKYGKTPLREAMADGHYDVAELLLANKAEADFSLSAVAQDTDPIYRANFLVATDGSRAALIRWAGDLHEETRDCEQAIARIKLAIQEPRIRSRFPDIVLKAHADATYQSYQGPGGIFSVEGELVYGALQQGHEILAQLSWAPIFTDFERPLGWRGRPFFGAVPRAGGLLAELLHRSEFTQDDLVELFSSEIPEVRQAALNNLTDQAFLAKTAIGDKDPEARRKAAERLAVLRGAAPIPR